MDKHFELYADRKGYPPDLTFEQWHAQLERLLIAYGEAVANFEYEQTSFEAVLEHAKKRYRA